MTTPDALFDHPELDLMSRLAVVEKLGPRRGYEVGQIVVDAVMNVAAAVEAGTLDTEAVRRACGWLTARTQVRRDAEIKREQEPEPVPVEAGPDGEVD